MFSITKTKKNKYIEESLLKLIMFKKKKEIQNIYFCINLYKDLNSNIFIKYKKNSIKLCHLRKLQN